MREQERVFLDAAKETGFIDNGIIDLEKAYLFQEMMMIYNCAIKEVRTKLEILNDELSTRQGQKPIEYISSRLKKPVSIAKKLKQKGLTVSVESMREHLTDIAGIRVVCPFIDDIYAVAEMLVKQDDITLITCKDYLEHPKPNGYRSLHLIVEVPVFFSDRKQPVKVEVQIRTIAMDFWASLEHQLSYKQNIPHADEIYRELRECSDVIAQTDMKMQIIKNKLHFSEDLGNDPDHGGQAP